MRLLIWKINGVYLKSLLLLSILQTIHLLLNKASTYPNKYLDDTEILVPDDSPTSMEGIVDTNNDIQPCVSSITTSISSQVLSVNLSTQATLPIIHVDEMNVDQITNLIYLELNFLKLLYSIISI